MSSGEKSRSSRFTPAMSEALVQVCIKKTTLNVIPTVNVTKINSKYNANHKCNKNQP